MAVKNLTKSFTIQKNMKLILENLDIAQQHYNKISGTKMATEHNLNELAGMVNCLRIAVAQIYNVLDAELKKS